MMKQSYYLFLLLLFIATELPAQKLFEGSIKYQVKIDGNGNDFIGVMMPESYTYYVKDLNWKAIISGGVVEAYMDQVLVLPGENAAYMLQTKQKKGYYIDTRINTEEKGKLEVKEGDVKIEKTNETQVIAGLTCRLYKVTVNHDEVQSVNEVWVNSKYFLKIPELESDIGLPNLTYAGLNGLPLKMKLNMKNKDMGFSMTLTAVNVNYKSLDPSLFKLPKAFEIKPISEFKPF